MKHIQLFEQFINEAKTDLVKYVKDASKKTFAKGGNGQNILDYTIDIAKYIQSYDKGEDAYGTQTVPFFMRLVDSMGLDDVAHNNISGKKPAKKDIFRGPSDLVDVVNSAIKMAKMRGGTGKGWDKATLELAAHLQDYKQGRESNGPSEDGFYGSSTLSTFTRLVDMLSTDDANNNKVSK